MDEELKRHRTRIDAIDSEILKLVNERGQHAQAIGHLKNGVGIYRPDREAQVLRRLMADNPGPINNDAIARLFREIMSICLALEKPLDIAFLGPAGTFSQQAAAKQFGQSAHLVDCASIDEVFRSVEAGSVDYGVVPVENSTEGAVGRTLDLLLATPLRICGEVTLPIHHFLLSRAEDLSAIQRVYSHVQSLGQCRGWLDQHLPQATRIQVVSNAEAARLASEDDNAAAIAGELAATLYQLNALARNIEDVPSNTTRFLVMGHHDAGPSGRDKTSLVLSTHNRPGAMHDLLTPLADNGVSMTKLESRPAKINLWEYVFYIDLEGHAEDASVKAALDALRQQTAFLKVLGSYPVAAF